MPGFAARQRGVVLIVVLWVIAMLTVLLAAFVATVKVERQTVADVALAVQGRAAMDAVLEYLAALQQVVPDEVAQMPGERFELLLNEQVVAFRIVPETDFIPINTLNAEQLALVLAGMGVAHADRLAGELVALRSDRVDEERDEIVPGQFVHSLIQLAQLLEVDVEQLRPYGPWLSFFGRHEQLTAGHVPESVLVQLGLNAQAARDQGAMEKAAAYRVQVEVVTDRRPRQLEAIAVFAEASYRLLHINEYNVSFSLIGHE